MALIKVIDYNYSETSSSDTYIIEKGNIEDVKNATKGSIEYPLKKITEKYLRERYNAVILITLNGKQSTEIISEYGILNLSDIAKDICDKYCMYPQCLIVSTIPLEIENNILSESVKSSLEFDGFKSLDYEDDFNTSKVMIKINDIGGNSFIDNMKEFW